MNKETQIEHYNKYLNEYMSENKICNTDKIRNDLKIFSMKIKSAIKVALEDSKETYENERIYMFSLAYAYEFEDSYFWTIVSTEKEYDENLKKYSEKKAHSQLMYYKYCPEESCHWDVGKNAFDILNEYYISMVEKQEYDDEDSFWSSDEFEDFYEKIEETCLRAIEEVKLEGILEELQFENILFQYYVREYYTNDKDIEMFKRLNRNDKIAIEEFKEWL
ncbi:MULTISPECIES: DUF4303 domain-containing protein [Clostridium]|uniref:DUF4303 domain-containing protein n=1 Tax=Clostridium TaxID=1485 RepID=UPI000983B376|nr:MULTISPECIES: DUF4303 domain-containing protein [Clostridium]AQR95947.1 hypothetical protein CLSAP_32650 [Clostridium saccharoperbutylacetonicum]NSB31814.1 hypothetical protein [Clostridium saccharoperbutylacetonicum]